MGSQKRSPHCAHLQPGPVEQMVARRERRSSIEAPAGIVAETVGEDEPSGGEIVMRKVLAHGCATIGLFLRCSPVLENRDLHPPCH